MSTTTGSSIDQFRTNAGLPLFTTDSITKKLYFLSLISSEWKSIFDSIQEDIVELPPGCEETINTLSTPSRTKGIDTDSWKELCTHIDQSHLKTTTKGLLEASSKDMKEFSKRVSYSMKEKNYLKPVTIAKVYLLAYQPQWQEMLQDVLKNTRYDTRETINDFIETHPSPDKNTLCKILSALK